MQSWDTANKPCELADYYIAVQTPESFARVWRWDDWVYDPSTGMIVSKKNPDELVPYNYLVFGVSRIEGE
ncbi:MAG: hypothetical protein WA231_12955 [Methylocella sp.]